MTSEADYMDDCHHADRWDDENRANPAYEVVDHRNKPMFSGSRAACWCYRKRYGGYVREKTDE